jgi:hypothetical protein
MEIVTGSGLVVRKGELACRLPEDLSETAGAAHEVA